MRDWLTGLGVAVGLLVASWGLLIVLARRLPPGLLRDLAAFIPDCVTTVRRLRRDARVPRKAKIAVIVAGLWVASPIDLIPEFIPIIGPLDDILVVALCLRYARRQVPRAVLLETWPGDPRLLQRLLGTPRRSDQRAESGRAGTAVLPQYWNACPIALASPTQVRAYRRTDSTAAVPNRLFKEAQMPFVVPDACTLPTVDQPLRLAEFDSLFATALRTVQPDGPTRTRMLLSGPAGLEATVRDLTARESECCSFFTFTVTGKPVDGAEAVTLVIAVPDAYADVLESLTDRAVAMSSGAGS